MQRLEGLLRKAVQDYEMIAPGDRVCVGVSGGKDSVALTVALGHLRRYLGVPFEVMAVTLDPRFGGVEADYQHLRTCLRRKAFLTKYGARISALWYLIIRKEPNPCALCAKMRRGALHAAAQELGCNKVALGHHLDDAVETFLHEPLAGRPYWVFFARDLSGPAQHYADPANDLCHRKRGKKRGMPRRAAHHQKPLPG